MKVIALSLEGKADNIEWDGVTYWKVEGKDVRLHFEDGQMTTLDLPMKYIGLYDTSKKKPGAKNDYWETKKAAAAKMDLSKFQSKS